jgi:hypothetical protein
VNWATRAHIHIDRAASAWLIRRHVDRDAEFVFVTDPAELAPDTTAFGAGNIQIVEVHNHSFTEQPRLFYLHFWAVDDAVSLAKALRPALDATNLQPA